MLPSGALERLQRAGAGIHTPAPVVLPEIESLRAMFDARYRRTLQRLEEIRTGERDPLTGLKRSTIERQGAGHGGTYQCWDCHRIGLSSVKQTCPHCGYAHGGVNHDAVGTR